MTEDIIDYINVDVRKGAVATNNSIRKFLEKFKNQPIRIEYKMPRNQEKKIYSGKITGFFNDFFIFETFITGRKCSFSYIDIITETLKVYIKTKKDN